MKKVLSVGLAVMCILMLAPLSVLGKDKAAVASGNIINVPRAEAAVSETFIVCNTETGENTEISAEDYIFGVVAAEMPALYNEEALKAQAVAAYTYACYRKAENSDKSYDITNDHTTDQSYLSEAEARERWGDNADTYAEKIKKAVKEVSGYMVTYDGKPALTVYHAISSGKTEAAENVWGKPYPYLVAADSTGDKLSPDYISVKTVSAEELASVFSGETEVSGEPSDYFKNINKTDSGAVETLTFCGKELAGSKVRSLLDLRSTCFDVSFVDGNFTFTVYGYGHGVGMSQYGADYMAKQGSGFKEILTCYYKSCKVEKVTK